MVLWGITLIMGNGRALRRSTPRFPLKRTPLSVSCSRVFTHSEGYAATGKTRRPDQTPESTFQPRIYCSIRNINAYQYGAGLQLLQYLGFLNLGFLIAMKNLLRRGFAFLHFLKGMMADDLMA